MLSTLFLILDSNVARVILMVSPYMPMSDAFGISFYQCMNTGRCAES
jgi:hypothetical protein